MEVFQIESKNGSPVIMKISKTPAIGSIKYMVNNDGTSHNLSIRDFFKNFIESSIPGQKRTVGLINEQDISELRQLFDAWNHEEEAKEEAELQEQTRKLREERERLQAELAKFRARLIEIKGLIDSLYPKIQELIAEFNRFHLLFCSDIDSELELLKPKKVKESDLERCEARFPTFDSSFKTEDAKFQAKRKELFENIEKLIAESEEQGYIFNPEKFNPIFRELYLKQDYVRAIKDKLSEFKEDITTNIIVSTAKLEEFRRKIEEKKADKKRARLSSVSSNDSGLSSARSESPLEAVAAPLAAAAAAPLAAAVAAAPLAAAAASSGEAPGTAAYLLSPSSGLPPRPKKGSLVLVKPVEPVEPVEPVVVIKLQLEPEKAKDMIRFIDIHERLLSLLEKKEKEKIIRRLQEFESVVEEATGTASSASSLIDSNILQIESLYDRVISQEYPNRLKQLFKKAEKIYKLSSSLAEQVGPCEGGGGGGRGCPEAGLAENAFDVLRGRQRELFVAEEAALETLLAEIQSDKLIREEALAREELEARSGFSPLKVQVSEYAEFLEHITRKANEIGFKVDESINRATNERVIFVRTRPGRPLHLTFSPIIRTKRKFHITHNQIPEEVDAKRFYFSIFDAGMKENYLYDIIEKRRIEIPEIVARFREELQKLRPLPSVEGLDEEVRDLLQFLLDNIDDSSTKKIGGFYEKYMKYKQKYMKLKSLI